MKVIKRQLWVIAVLLGFLLSGCYTQLKVTDRTPVRYDNSYGTYGTYSFGNYYYYSLHHGFYRDVRSVQRYGAYQTRVRNQARNRYRPRTNSVERRVRSRNTYQRGRNSRVRGGRKASTSQRDRKARSRDRSSTRGNQRGRTASSRN